MLAASLAELSDGRFVLGLGAGSPPLAEGFHDVPFTAPVERLGAVTRQVRRLLDGQRLEQSVERANRPLRLAVPPQTEVPIYLAALGPRAVRLAGELADGWYPFLLPLSGLESGIRSLEEGKARGEPGRSLPAIGPCIPAAIAADPATALQVASWWVSFYLVSMGPLYRDTLRRLGHGQAVDAVLAANPTPHTFDVPSRPGCCSTSSPCGGTRSRPGRRWIVGTPPAPRPPPSPFHPAGRSRSSTTCSTRCDPDHHDDALSLRGSGSCRAPNAHSGSIG